MKKTVSLIAMVFLTLSLFASGYWGSYKIKGVAKNNGKVLIDEKIRVKYGITDTIIQTDSAGTFEIIIPWSTFHSIGISGRLSLKQNQKSIVFEYGKKRIRVKNEWKLSYNVLLGKAGLSKKYEIIKYEDGKEPGMFGNVDSYKTPNILIRKDLRF